MSKSSLSMWRRLVRNTVLNGGRHVHQRAGRRPFHTEAALERLEDRTLLAATLVDSDPGADVTFDLTTGDDVATLRRGTQDFDANVELILDSTNGSFNDKSFEIAAGATLTINTGSGVDNLTIDDVVFDGDLTINGDAAVDTVSFDNAATNLGGGTLNVDAEFVNVNQSIAAAAITGTGVVVNVDDPGSIQDGIDLADAGAIVNVAAGTYTEDVTVDKTVTLNGANAGIAAGVDAGTRGTESVVDGGFRIQADDVTLDGFTIQNGVGPSGIGEITAVFVGTGRDRATVQNSILQGPGGTGNLRGIITSFGAQEDLNVIDNEIFGWDTGVYGQNLDGLLIDGNFIHGNSSAGSANDFVVNALITGNVFANNGAAVGSFDSNAYQGALDGIADITVFNNNLSGNTRTISHHGGDVIDARGNWWGTTDEAAIIASIRSDGTLGDASKVDFTPYLATGTDTSATAGFQGDFSTLHVTTLGSQTGTSGRIQEGIDLVDAGGTVFVRGGTYTGNVDATGKAVTLSAGASPGQVFVNGNFTLDSDDTLAIELDGTDAASEFDNFVVTGMVTLGGADLTVAVDDLFPAQGGFAIISNDGADMVNGTFNGLINGSTFSVNGVPVTINYDGGDGNDVVLTIAALNTVYVNDDWTITTDVGPSGLSNGDTVSGDGQSGRTFGYDAFAAVQDGIDAVAVDGTVNVLAGTYYETLSIQQSVDLIGAGSAVTTITTADAVEQVVLLGGGSGGPSPVLNQGALIEGFTFVSTSLIGDTDLIKFRASGTSSDAIVIRNNVFDGQNLTKPIETPAGGAVSHVVIENNTFQDARYGMFLNSAIDWRIEGNTFTDTGWVALAINTSNVNQTHDIDILNNTFLRSGQNDGFPSYEAAVQLASTVYNVNVTGNVMADGDGHGVYIIDRGNLNFSNVHINNNSLTNNALGSANELSVAVDMSANWWGTTDETAIDTRTSGPVDFTPYLAVGTDTSAAAGFQGDFSTLYVTDEGSQVQTGGRINEAIGLVDTGGTVFVNAGAYAENVLVDKNLDLVGATGTAADVVIDPTSGNGIEIAASGTSTADRLTVQDLTVTDATNGVYFNSAVSHVELDNVVSSNHASYGIEVHNDAVVNDLLLTGVTSTGNSVGFRVSTTGVVDGLTITGSHFDNNAFGLHTARDSSVANNETGFTNVNVTNTTFNNNTSKGIYAEKLDNAVFDDITVDNSGTVGSYAAGIDINLKNGSYGSITIQNSNISDSGVTAAADSARALAVKARNDGSNGPTTLESLTLANVAITGSDEAMYISGDGNTTVLNMSGLTLTNTGADGGFIEKIATWNFDTTIGADDVIDLNTLALSGEGTFQHTRGASVQDLLSFANVATLDVDTLDGNDTVNVAAHSSTVINLDGGDPSTLAGDTLNYVAGVAAFSDDGSTITTTGQADINYVNFETLSTAPALIVANPSPAVIDEGEFVTLSGSVADPDDDPTVTIDWGDGSTDTVLTVANGGLTENPTGVYNYSAIHQYTDDDADDTYTIEVTAADGDHTAEQTKTVTVNNVAPTPTIDSIGTARVEGTAIAVSGSATDPASANDTLSYEWTIITGGAVYATGQGTDFTFTPDDPGHYTITLTVSDEDGGSASVSKTIAVENNVGLVVGPRTGASSLVRVYDAAGQNIRFSFQAYGNYQGGVKIATGDVNGDGVLDIITAPGGTNVGADIRIWDGETGQITRQFFAYPPGFKAAYNVASGDVDGDGYDDIIVSIAGGTVSDVRSFSGRTGQVIVGFHAYGNYRGGVRVATGDINGDGIAEIITTPGSPGAAADVRVFNGTNGQLLHQFFAFRPNYTDGSYNIAAGDVNGDGRDDIVVAVASGLGPEVRVFNGATLTTPVANPSLISRFFAYNRQFRGGVSIALGDVNSDGRADIITSPFLGAASYVRVFDGVTASVISVPPQPFPNSYKSGTYLGGHLYDTSVDHEAAAPEFLRLAGPVQADSNLPTLQTEQAQGLVAAAASRFREAGFSQTVVNQVAATKISVADLAGETLAVARDDGIVLDANAAGWGWFVDETPNLDEEFTRDENGMYRAVAGSAAQGKLDLLTVLTHEIAHELGFGHDKPTVGGGSLMTPTLAPGARQATREQLDELFEDTELMDELLAV